MGIKKEYTIKLRCAKCGCEDHFEYNKDKSYVKCTFCNREYIGGIEELKELNHAHFDDTKKEIQNDVTKHLKDLLRKSFKGNKFIKFK